MISIMSIKTNLHFLYSCRKSKVAQNSQDKESESWDMETDREFEPNFSVNPKYPSNPMWAIYFSHTKSNDQKNLIINQLYR